MWRFLGFVALVIAGLAAVFYYKGQAEEKNVVQQAVKKEAARMVVSSPLEASKNPEVVVTEVPQATSIGTFGSSIVIQAELKPREEQEVIFEVENLTTPIEQIFKGIGAEVKPGDVLVKMEDIMIKERLEGQRQTATDLADAKIKSAENAQDVYEKEVSRNSILANQGASSKAELELSLARRDQAKYDIIKSKVEKSVEETRLREITQQAELFHIKARIPGTIVKVFKKKGSSVRGGEAIMHIVNDKELLVDGAVESGFSSRIEPGKTVVLEPDNDREAQFLFNGHTGSITSLALAPLNRFLASSSEDGSVILWNLFPARELPWIRLERPDHRRVGCKCVAVSPSVTADTYLLLAGYSDGSIYRWSVKLPASGKPVVEAQLLEKVHDQAVNCVAFRGDGAYAATGSDDRRVALWNVKQGKKLYYVQAEANSIATTHFGGVTSVSFTRDGQHLLTAGTDNSIRRWKLGTDKSELVKMVQGRSGDIKQFNLADDTRYIFSEHGDELRLLDTT
ncbi:MAG TPA: HlyD family efflux transporter periplasmic adaptor subunit, partial [Gemmatales bacterium]|nr:HlyD family efflux transporter periplasmic adaptor subunit [Gemmatales bacterium]